MPNKGLLIAFEGIDGSGKSVQAARVYDELINYGIDCVLTHEPTDRSLGRVVKDDILNSSLKLDNMTLQIAFTADRSDHVKKVIQPALDRSAIILTDRYYWSTVAYGRATGLNSDWLFEMNKIFPKPDITFWFKIPPEVASERRRQRALAPRTLEADSIQIKVNEAYGELKDRYSPDGWHTIDATRTIDDVFIQVMRPIDELLKKNGFK